MKTAQDFLRHEIPAKMWKHISGDLELIILKAMYKYTEEKTKELEKEIAKWKEANFELLCHPAIAEAATNEKMLSNLYSELDDCHDRIRELESCLNSTSGR